MIEFAQHWFGFVVSVLVIIWIVCWGVWSFTHKPG